MCLSAVSLTPIWMFAALTLMVVKFQLPYTAMLTAKVTPLIVIGAPPMQQEWKQCQEADYGGH